jgi:TfoX/Sxy family transcriptional regulator of competence genes
MAYDEGLAQRIRELLEDDPRVAEKKMFGGVAFLVDGHMACGIIRDELMVRVGPEAHAEAIAQPYARPMDFTKRPMRGFVQVTSAGFEADADLASWVARGVDFAGSRRSAPAPRPKATVRRRSTRRTD